MKYLITILASLFLVFISNTKAQTMHTVSIPGQSHYIFYNSGNSSYGNGQNALYAGINGNTYRSYISWDNIRTYIPQNSQLTSVTFSISWGGNGHSTAQIQYRDFSYGTVISQTYSNIGSGTLWDTKSATTSEYSFSQLTDKVQSAVNGGPNEVHIGIKNQNESNSNYNVSYPYDVNLSVTYISNQITVTQVDKDGDPFGQVGEWQGSSWLDKNVPFNKTFPAGSDLGLRSYQNFKPGTDQKYLKWMQNEELEIPNPHKFTTVTTGDFFVATFNPTVESITIQNSIEGTQIDPESDSIKFADPWYSDYAEPGLGNSPRNRGMKNTGSDALQYRSRRSPFYPDNSTIYQNGNDPSHAYQGVFLDQDYNIPGQPYYSVQALSSQPVTLPGIGTRDFYFFSWDYDENKISLQNPLYATTGVVFKQADATLTANLKGHLLSNSQNALSGGSQRRLVRTDNGIYHLVYESMGVIWYTHSNSTSFNGSWSAEAGVEIGKNPSMDFYQNTVKIVCEKSDADSSIIEMITIDPDYNNPLDFDYEDVIHFPLSYYGNAKPVITFNTGFTFIAYRENPGDGIYWASKISGNWTLGNIISSTNSECNSPSIKCNGTNVYIVYVDNFSIKFIACTYSGYWRFNPSENVSFNSGNNVNTGPSISLTGYGYPVVSWIGSYSSSGINKGTGTGAGDIPPMVVARRRGSSWGSFFKSGSNVLSVNSNSSNNSTEQTVIAWSEETDQGYQSKWVRRVDTSYIPTQNLSSDGIQTQVSNGTDLTDMGGVLLSTATTPYDLPLLTTNFNAKVSGGPGGTTKITNYTDLGYGREGIISKNGVEFLFDIGDVIVGDSVIKFIYRPDTLSYASAEELNEVVRTESFPLDPSAEFYFTDFYYVLNPGAADTLLSGDDLVNFKAELVDAGSGSIAGTFDNVTYTKEQLTEHNNVSYRVDCSNITPGIYYLRLVTTVQGDAEYSLADVQNNADELAKHSYNEIVYDGSKLPETYDLSQNFPNPFNPATTINYQLPENGFVTLKIYDILGKEVATLVNEQKNQGRYSINFDASKLASGVYIYQIRVNDYVSSKKMLLLK